ncbi:MAG TPA: hypothetical protein QF469_05825 [Sphingomonas sanguinis]|uniref:hypothetical protein n=1 Tax=Sphingomonas sanguinis TaxID=33051 RepID=UPI002AC2FA63|nr:hypothetical protein [Sphingomonas sanguinis]
MTIVSDCLCPSLPDLAHISMGDHRGRDEQFVEAVKVLLNAGLSQWWLYLGQCGSCQQNWLLAQEERIYDEHLLVKISQERADAALDAGKWPDTFSTYESVLTIAQTLSHPGQFLDPMAWSLLCTVEDLRRERHDISEDEMAHLLGISRRHVHRLIVRNARASIGERMKGWLSFVRGNRSFH